MDAPNSVNVQSRRLDMLIGQISASPSSEAAIQMLRDFVKNCPLEQLPSLLERWSRLEEDAKEGAMSELAQKLLTVDGPEMIKLIASVEDLFDRNRLWEACSLKTYERNPAGLLRLLDDFSSKQDHKWVLHGAVKSVARAVELKPEGLKIISMMAPGKARDTSIARLLQSAKTPDEIAALLGSSNLEGLTENQAFLQDLCFSFSNSAPQLAYELAEKLDAPLPRRLFIAGQARTLAASPDPNDALNWARELPGRFERRTALVAIAEEWGADRPLDAAEQTQSLPRDVRFDWLDALVASDSKTSADQWMSWLEQQHWWTEMTQNERSLLQTRLSHK